MPKKREEKLLQENEELERELKCAPQNGDEKILQEEKASGSVGSGSAVATLEKEIEALKDTHLRTLAEYDNFRKRTAKEREGLFAIAKAAVIEQMLPVYDNLERAIQQPSGDEAYKKGIEMIMKQLNDVFARVGVTEIAAQGATFDPEKHNAVAHCEDEELGKGVVAEVFQKGFEADGKVIRHAVVKVAN